MRKVYRVVRDGIPGMDGVNKTLQISGEFDTRERAELALELLTQGKHDTSTTRIQSRDATDWEDME